jgi:hypothetical protein
MVGEYSLRNSAIFMVNESLLDKTRMIRAKGDPHVPFYF